jgi:hypothetical protein
MKSVSYKWYRKVGEEWFTIEKITTEDYIKAKTQAFAEDIIRKLEKLDIAEKYEHTELKPKPLVV